MTDAVVALVACANEEQAVMLARTLVEERLAACGNIVPGVRSIYWWQGKVQEDAEVLLVLKTRQDRFEGLRERTAALHSYECPEIVCVPIAAGHAPYLRWLDENVREGT